jgi:hypothetical protein
MLDLLVGVLDHPPVRAPHQTGREHLLIGPLLELALPTGVEAQPLQMQLDLADGAARPRDKQHPILHCGERRLR